MGLPMGRPATLRRVENEFWDNICAGATRFEAAVAAGVGVTTGERWLRVAGGIRPRLVVVIGVDPQTRTRCLTEYEREHIALRRAQRAGVRQIGRELRRQPSTISREIRRHRSFRRPTDRVGHYSGLLAQSRAEQRRRRPKPRKLAGNAALAEHVQQKLDKQWSPRQIAATLVHDHPDDPEMRVSHETIYQSLYVQGRGGLRRDLHKQLRTGRALRRPRAASRRPSRSSIPDPVSISERPAEVADRAVPGHWEGDLIIGKAGTSAIGTLVERSTRYCLLLHLPDGHGAEQVRDAMIAKIPALPAQLWRSLTWDRGTEMAKHRDISIATGLPIYFCDPRSPWQRGSNENTNGLLRQYFPKGTDLSQHTPEHLDAVAVRLNGRPRETLGWQTPAQALNELLSQPFNTDGVATTA
jgi:IS30 family transposase